MKKENLLVSMGIGFALFFFVLLFAIVSYLIGFDEISCAIMLALITTSLLMLMGKKKNAG